MKHLIFFLALFFTSACTQIPQAPLDHEPDFDISRTLDATPKEVFGMIKDPEKFLQWMGPSKSRMKFLKADVKEGGTATWSLTTADGKTKYGTYQYMTIKPGKLFIYHQHFTDERGNLIKPFFSPRYPDKLRTRIYLEPVGKDKTSLTVTWLIVGDVPDIERQTFQAFKPHMKTGWGQSLDKLEELLKK